MAKLSTQQVAAMRTLWAGPGSQWSTDIKPRTFESLYRAGYVSRMTVNEDHHIYDLTTAGRNALERASS